ncbi:MAG: high-potential iron-sulfur protein [Halobacteriaceae archaeon]
MTGDGQRRRTFLRTLGAAAALSVAGCGARDRSNPALEGPVPDRYRTATAVGGTPRDPDHLYSKAGVNYHTAVGEQRCANCALYVPDRDGDGLGACAVVEGSIEPDGWCTVYEPVREG